jgi:hypothetical protein
MGLSAAFTGATSLRWASLLACRPCLFGARTRVSLAAVTTFNLHTLPLLLPPDLPQMFRVVFNTEFQ